MKHPLDVEGLRAALDGIPGHYTIWLTLPDDELRIRCVTQDRNTIRLCADASAVPENEHILYMRSED